VLTLIVTVRAMYVRSHEVYANRYPKEGKGSRVAEHSANGKAQAWADAGAVVLHNFAMQFWREEVTYRHEDESRYWDYQAARVLYDVEEMLGNIGWVFALQKLLGGKPGSGQSYTQEDEEE